MASNIALQTYTLRDFCKTPHDIARTMKRVREIGYQAVQASGLGPIEASELHKILDGEGLKCVATHVGLDKMESELSKIIDDHATLQCELTAIGGFFDKEYTADGWKNFVARYNKIAKSLGSAKLRIGYHNHSHEFMKFDGKPVMQMLIESLDPSIWMEIDTYWVQHGGADPAVWIEKVKGRIPSVHFKDMGVAADKKPAMMEVGEGNLNWPAILKACKSAGVQWYTIEQDICQRDPFEAIAISLRNTKAMGIN